MKRFYKIKTYITRFRGQIILSIIVLLILDLFSSTIIERKWYRFISTLDEKHHFTVEHINSLKDEEDSVIELSVFAPAINQSKQSVNFIIFSRLDFQRFLLKDMTIIIDGKEIKLSKDFMIEKQSQKIEYNFGEKIIGYYFLAFGNYENNYLVNFKKIFRSKNAQIGDTFEIQIKIHYFLDDREYNKMLHYVIECRKDEMDYPPNWFMFFFPGAY